MKGTVIITGANSQLAQCINSILTARGMSFLFEYKYIFATHAELDITKPKSIEEYVSKYDNVKYIVNCAAYTNVEKSNEEYNTAVAVNQQGVENLGAYCKEHDIFLITFGTDFMYNPIHIRPIKEDDDRDPLNGYGKSKLWGYYALSQLYPANDLEKHFLFINTSWLYSEFGNNFVKKIYNAVKNGEQRKVVIDQVGTPTYAPNLARFVIDYIERDEKPRLKTYGLINVAGKGVASWYDLAKTVEDIVKQNNALDSLIQPCLSSDFKSKVKRPEYSALSTKLLEDNFGVDAYTRYWREDVEMCVKNLILLDSIDKVAKQINQSVSGKWSPIPRDIDEQ